jgi:hypothetical protein
VSFVNVVQYAPLQTSNKAITVKLSRSELPNCCAPVGYRYKDQGLILPTKKSRRFFCILAKFSVFCKFQQNFQVCLIKNLQKKNLEILPAGSTKKLHRKFFSVHEIFVCKKFSLVLLWVE